MEAFIRSPRKVFWLYIGIFAYVFLVPFFSLQSDPVIFHARGTIDQFSSNPNLSKIFNEDFKVLSAFRGMNFEFFLDRNNFPQDFQLNRFKNLLMGLYSAIIFYIGYLIEFFISKKDFIKARMLSSLGILLTTLGIVFLYFDLYYLYKVVFQEVISKIPLINSADTTFFLTRIYFCFALLAIFFITRIRTVHLETNK